MQLKSAAEVRHKPRETGDVPSRENAGRLVALERNHPHAAVVADHTAAAGIDQPEFPEEVVVELVARDLTI